MFLDDEELEMLTGKQRRSAQAKALCFMGIEHKLRPDGSVAVLRSHVEKMFGESAVSTIRRKTDPDFSMVV